MLAPSGSRLPVLLGVILLVALPAGDAAGAGSAAERSAEGSRGRPGTTSRGSVENGGGRTRSRAPVVWRQGPAGWSRLGLPGLRSLRRRQGRKATAGGGRDRTRASARRIVAGPPARLTIEIRPPSASVFLDGEWIGRGADLSLDGAVLEVTPGSHRLVVGDPDHLSRTLVLELEPGRASRVEIRLAPRPEAAAGNESRPDARPRRTKPRRPR